MTPEWTQEETDKLVEMYNAGCDISTMARAFDTSIIVMIITLETMIELNMI